MTHPNVQPEDEVRETKRADRLGVGDWLNDDFFGTGPIRVAATVPFAERVLIVYTEPGEQPDTVDIHGDALLALATPAEVSRAEASAERDSFVRSLREFANWFDRHPDLPVPSRLGVMVHLHGADNVEQVSRVAESLDLKIEDNLDDRRVARVDVGLAEYAVIAWLKPDEDAPAEEVAADRPYNAIS